MCWLVSKQYRPKNINLLCVMALYLENNIFDIRLSFNLDFYYQVSARFWLMDCRNIQEVTKLATTLYKEVIHVPFMAKYVFLSPQGLQDQVDFVGKQIVMSSSI